MPPRPPKDLRFLVNTACATATDACSACLQQIEYTNSLAIGGLGKSFIGSRLIGAECAAADAAGFGVEGKRRRARREHEQGMDPLRARFKALTSREREIMIQVAQGRLSKQIAGVIGVTESTVKVHRSNLMRKMEAHSLPELSRMADKLKLAPEKPPRG